VSPSPNVSASGIAILAVTPNLNNISIPNGDIVKVDQAIAQNYVLNSLIIHDVTGATTGGIYSGAAGTNGSLVNNLTPGYYAFGSGNGIATTQQFAQSVDSSPLYVQVNSATNPGGATRGQFYSQVNGRRREVPVSFTSGVGTISGNLAQLQRATQFGNDNNPKSYVQLIPASTGSFSGVFIYVMPVNALNLKDIRLIRLDVNARSAGDNSTWLFSILNLATGAYDNLGTLTPGQTWASGYVGENDYQVPAYVSSGGRVSIKVSSSSNTTVPFWLDQLSLRPYIPDSSALQFTRAFIRNARVAFNF